VADPYVYPGTSVLRNLAGLHDADELADHEAQASTLRLVQLAALRLEGAYDLAHLQEFHRFVFQDIYAWAGELRSVPLAKPGSMFALPEHIEGYATEVLRQLSDERHLHDLPRDGFAERLTHYFQCET
jgi:cell filamentation protein